MRLFRKITHVCQNCINGNNEKGKWIRKRFRNPCPEGHWHIFCEKKQKYYPWDKYKLCFSEKRKEVGTMIEKKKKLTLKQLYGYSIMNWELFLKNLELLNFSRECSFCRDSNDECESCRIDSEICNFDLETGPIRDFLDRSESLYLSIQEIISQLRVNYFKLNDVLKIKQKRLTTID